MSEFSEYLNTVNGTLMGVGLLLSGVGTILSLRRGNAETNTPAPLRSRRIGLYAILGGGTMLILGAILVAVRAASGQDPLNVQLTTAAWSAFNEADYAQAIVAAERCASEFRGVADREQTRLEIARVPDPPVGSVPSSEKAVIFARGPLNDVATCFWIKGSAAQATGQAALAKEAYLAAARYTYARTWDPKGWFWAPAQDARDRLARMR
jgi:hypothetical protein